MRKHLLTIFICLLLHIPGYAQHATAIFLPDAKFITGNDASWSAPDFRDSAWKILRTGTVWQEQGFEGYHGYAWYRIHVFIPTTLRDRGIWKDSLRIFLAHVNDVDETWLNGVRIGKTGSFPDDPGGYGSKWPATRSYHVAVTNNAIHWGKDNVIAIKVYDGGGTGGIFMGAPYIDMLEKIDGVEISASPSTIRFNDSVVMLPIRVRNLFNTTIRAGLIVECRDEVTGATLIERSIRTDLAPFSDRSIPFTLPNRPGIVFSYSFKPAETDERISATQRLPYILTPKAPEAPRINCARLYGAHPGVPFLFRVATSGKRPMTFKLTGLPEGLVCDPNTGIITGTIRSAGSYRVSIFVRNGAGQAAGELIIRAGEAIALTPPMGWNSWNCWGINVSAEKVRSSAQALLDMGLADYGWTYINIDDGWEDARRAPDSAIRPNEKFGDMRALADWLHANGLKFGIYSSPGPRTCGGYLGSYKNEYRDAGTYADWGVDYLKYDWCSYDGIAGSDTSLAMYMRPYLLMRDALAQQRRDIVFSLCQYGMHQVWRWGPQVNGQSWRTTGDIEDTWHSLSRIGFSQYRLSAFAGPGHWNDPDMMIVGQVGWGEDLHPSRLTPDEQYTHVSLWSLLAAPLLIGCDLSKLDPFTQSLLTNPEVLAIDQDTLGEQAVRVLDRDNLQVFVKSLGSGDKAVGFFNTDSVYKPVSVGWAGLGLPPDPFVRDPWRQKDLGRVKEKYQGLIPPHGVSLIIVSAKASKDGSKP